MVLKLARFEVGGRFNESATEPEAEQQLAQFLDQDARWGITTVLEMGLFQRRPLKGQMIFRSDRGSQYAGDDFRHVLDQHGVVASTSRKGNCWDNTATETLFGSLKVDRFHGECFPTIRQAMDTMLSWLLWYNRQRKS